MDFSFGENQQAVIEAAVGVLGRAGSVNEIQRELIATAGLGLPRVPR